MKNINIKLKKYAEKFVQEVCINAWEMNEAQVKAYCLMIAKQNALMAHFDPDYLPTAVTYATLAGLSAEEIEILVKGGEQHAKTNNIQ